MIQITVILKYCICSECHNAKEKTFWQTLTTYIFNWNDLHIPYTKYSFTLQSIIHNLYIISSLFSGALFQTQWNFENLLFLLTLCEFLVDLQIIYCTAKGCFILVFTCAEMSYFGKIPPRYKHAVIALFSAIAGSVTVRSYYQPMKVYCTRWVTVLWTWSRNSKRNWWSRKFVFLKNIARKWPLRRRLLKNSRIYKMLVFDWGFFFFWYFTENDTISWFVQILQT